MTIPSTIPISSIDFGVRGRSTYSGIEALAESIEHVGLCQPIVLSRTGDCNTAEQELFSLVAGGRRLTALLSLGVTELHHGVTSCPGRYGFVLREEPGTEVSNLLLEIAENRDRQDVDWRDELKMIVRAGRLIQRDGHANGVKILQRDLGAILGCNYNDINTAFAVYDDLVTCPQDYKECSGLRASLPILLKKNQRFLESLQVQNSFVRNKVQKESSPKDATPVENVLSDGQKLLDSLPDIVPSIVVPLTKHIFHTDGLRYLSFSPNAFDHIICDPDFAVSKERLAAGVAGSAEGVAQDSVETSLVDLEQFIHLAAAAIRPRGFLAFFYDLDHHEKCQSWATAAGFAVQRWPIVWHKTDYRSNAAPAHNTCKNIEYLMVCRKPSSTLAVSPQMSSIIACDSEGAAKEFGHPFAKPRKLWQRLFSMFCIKGQTVFDPFMGSASGTCSAIEFGLNALGAEIQEVHYNRGMLNVQAEYRKLLGKDVTFE